MDFLSKYTSNPSILHYDRQARVVLRGHPPTFKIPGGQKISTKNAKEMKFLKIIQNVAFEFFNFDIFHKFLSDKNWPVW